MKIGCCLTIKCESMCEYLVGVVSCMNPLFSILVPWNLRKQKRKTAACLILVNSHRIERTEDHYSLNSVFALFVFLFEFFDFKNLPYVHTRRNYLLSNWCSIYMFICFMCILYIFLVFIYKYIFFFQIFALLRFKKQ